MLVRLSSCTVSNTYSVVIYHVPASCERSSYGYTQRGENTMEDHYIARGELGNFV